MHDLFFTPDFSCFKSRIGSFYCGIFAQQEKCREREKKSALFPMHAKNINSFLLNPGVFFRLEIFERQGKENEYLKTQVAKIKKLEAMLLEMKNHQSGLSEK